MGTGTERSNSLHNFTMPDELRWGNQRFLRCLKVNSDGRISPLRRVAANNSDQRRRSNCVLHSRTARDGKIDSCSEFLDGSRKVGRNSPPASDSGCDDGIAAIREKVILDLQTAADEIKSAIFKDGDPPAAAIASVESELSRPWNLRTRRADLKTLASRLVPSTNVDVVNSGVPQMKSGLPSVIDKPMSGGKRERPKFSVALSKNEIEEDFYSMVGHRPPRRPKKRARNVQRQLDTLFPGLWLSEVTPDMYKVPEGEAR